MTTNKELFLISTTFDIGTLEAIDMLSSEQSHISKINFFAILNSLHQIQDNYIFEQSLLAKSTGDYLDPIPQEVFHNLFEQIIIDQFDTKNKKCNFILDRGISIQRSLINSYQVKFIKDMKSIFIYTHPVILAMRSWNQITEIYNKSHDPKYLESLSVEGVIDISKYCQRYVKSWIDSVLKISSFSKLENNILFLQYDDLYCDFDKISEKLSNFLNLRPESLNKISTGSREKFSTEYDLIRKIKKPILSNVCKSIKKELDLSFIEI